MKRFRDEELRRVRNEISLREVIETLLQIPYKEIEGVYRFLCPACNEFQTGLNPHTNLARCFGCQKNFNPIELVMAHRGLSFVQSVTLLLQKESALSAGPQHRQERSEGDLGALQKILPQQAFRRDTPCSAG